MVASASPDAATEITTTQRSKNRTRNSLIANSDRYVSAAVVAGTVRSCRLSGAAHNDSRGRESCPGRGGLRRRREHPEDPLDPQWILRELPDRERANFLTAYREALDGARDPAGWGQLRRVLRLWSGVVIAANRPGFYEAQETALTGTGGGMLLEDYIRLRRTQA